MNQTKFLTRNRDPSVSMSGLDQLTTGQHCDDTPQTIQECPGFLSSLRFGSKSIDIQTEVLANPEPCIMVTAYYFGRVLLSQKNEYNPETNSARSVAGQCHKDMEKQIRTRLTARNLSWEKEFLLGAKEPSVLIHDSKVTARLSQLDAVNGILGSCLVGWDGSILENRELGSIDIRTLASESVEIARAEQDMICSLNLEEDIEDIIIATQAHYHVIRPVMGPSKFLLCVALNREDANLALARHQLMIFANDIKSS